MTSFNLLVLNGLRTMPGITTFLQVGAREPAAFPDDMTKVVVKGWAAEPMGNRTLVLSQGSIVSSCQLPIQVAWRCELTLPVGSFNQTQTVKMNADTRTLLSEISIESTTSPDPKVKLTVPAEPAFVTMGHADLFLVGNVLVVNGIRIKQFTPLTVTARARTPAMFPNNTMKLVVKGSMAEPVLTHTMVFTSGSISKSCVLPSAPASWRCEVTLPITDFGEKQDVKIKADTNALLSEISIE